MEAAALAEGRRIARDRCIRRYGIDANAVLAKLLGEHHRETVDRSLGGRIDRQHVIADQCRGGAHVDDSSRSARDHCGQYGVGHAQDRAEVQVYIGHPLVGIGIGEKPLVDIAADVVDENVDAADLSGAITDFGGRCGIEHVGGHELRAAGPA